MGGLTILSEIEKALPYENIAYYADSKNCPYGNKSKKEVLKLTHESIIKLIELGVDIIVVACNTATSSSIKELREEFKNIQFIATEPAVKPAFDMTNTNTIAVFATKRTIEGEALKLLCDKYGQGRSIIKIATPELVHIVEQNRESSDESVAILNKYIESIANKSADVLVLGCTHYSFLKKEIEQITNKYNIKVIDAAKAITKQTVKVLTELNLQTNSKEKGDVKFCSSLSKEYNNKLKIKYIEYTNIWQKR